jgi:antitoxin component of MazEF toxin-antitoxin module
MTKVSSSLWKIGSSVVMTVPSAVVKEIGICGKEKRILSIIVERPFGFNFLARPWKCGGSYVITVPSSCVEVFGLGDALKDKTEFDVNMVVANGRLG